MSEVPTFHAYWLAVPLALLPGLLGLWWSRAIPADPAVLPEWNFTQTQRVTLAATMCTMAIVAIAGWGGLWLLAVEFLVVSSVRHRTRRRLFAESWPLASYLAWRVRALVGAFGLWAFIALSPAIVVSVSGAARWWTALACIAIGLLWHHFNFTVLVRVLGATPLTRPDLDAGFTQVFSHASIGRPGLWHAGAQGGMLANALALPSVRGHGVLFFDTLLEQLSPEEITAILAHEVAHLEHFSGSLLRRMYIGASVAIAGVTIVAALLSAMAPELTWLVTLLWPAGVIGGLWARAARMQGHETKSDLRAVELCGDADALISALTRVYAINHIPRRFSAHTEARATHPSLARRIRDIRERSGQTSPAHLEGRLVFASSGKGRFAILEQDRLSFVWSNAEPGGADDILMRASRIETLAYGELGELRLTTSASGASLTAVDHHARRWTMPLRREDAARVQGALDVVDQLLGRPKARSASGLANRLIALCVLGLATGLRSGLSILVPALLILARPSRQLLVAMSASLVGAAIFSLNSILPDSVLAVVLLILAAIVLWRARSAPKETPARAGIPAWIEPAALALPVLIGAVMAVAGGGHPYDIQILLRDQGWLASSLLGIVGYLGASPHRAVRRTAPAAAVVASFALWASSPWFISQVGGDPLVVEMPVLDEHRLTLHPVGRAVVGGEFEFGSVALTPDGTHFLLTKFAGEYDDEEAAEPRRFVVGDFTGWSRELRAIDARLVDEHQVLVLDHRRGDSELRLEEIRGGSTRWTVTVPDMTAAAITGTSGDRWRVVQRRRNTFTRVEGQLAGSSFDRVSWKMEAGELGYPVEHYTDGAPTGLTLAYQWSTGLFEWPSSSHARTSLMTTAGEHSQPVATTHLMVHCVDPAIDVDGFVCVAYDGRRSFVWRLDPAIGALTPVGQIRGYLQGRAHERRDTLSAAINGLPARIALDSHSIAMLRVDDDECDVVLDHAVAGPLLVAVCRQEDGTLVRLYRMDD